MKWRSINFREVIPTLSLALPIVGGNVSGMLMGWVDTIMVGRLGVVPLAAVAFAVTIWIFFYFIGAGFVLSISVRTAEAHGARDIPALGEWLSACLMISLIVGVLTTIAGLGFIKCLPLLGQDPEVVKICVGFYTYIILSLIPNFLWLGLKTFLDAVGRPWIGLWILIASVGLNIFLNWLFIFGNWGFPRWEATGAGIATLAARIFSVICIIPVFLWTPSLRSLLLRSFRWKWGAISNLFWLGTPITLQMLSECVAFNMGAIMIGWLGAAPLAAHQIAITIAATTYMIPLGVGTALTIRMGNLLGAEEHERLACTVYSTILATCIFMGCVGILVIIFSGYIPRWFVDSRAVDQVATQLLVIMGILQIADALYILAQSGLRGLSDVRFPAFTTLVTYLGFGVTCAFVLGMVAKWQAPGVWIGLFLGTAISGLLCFVRLRKKIAQIAAH